VALPGKLGASLADGMSKVGLMAPGAPPAEEEPLPAEEDGGSIDEIISDIDEKVPGLGALIHELVDRLKAYDEESDAAEG
jgi:hypothetical protein